MINKLAIFLCNNRWINRYIRYFLPNMAWVKLNDKFKFFIYPRDISGPSFMITRRGFDGYEMQNRRKLSDWIPNQNAVFIDIGANIGIFSIDYFLNKDNIKIFAFEPVPHIHHCFQQTITSNHIKNIHLSTLALSNISHQTHKIYINAINDGNHSLNQTVIHKESKTQNVIEIQTITLDDFVDTNQIEKIDAIKIDVEGYEFEVLLGAKQTLQKMKPAMLIECRNQFLLGEKSVLHLLAQIPEANYQMLDLDSGKSFDLAAAIQIVQHHLEQGREHWDYLFYAQ